MRAIWRSPSLLLATAILLTLGACGVTSPDEPVEAPEVEVEVEAPEPDDEPLEDLMIEGPRLVATGSGTLLSEGPDLASETLEDGATVPVYAGIHLRVAEEASADLGWPAVADDPSSDFATGQLLAGTHFNIEASDPEIKSVALAQDAGTARFKLLESEEAADLSLRAGMVNVHASEPSDFILSYHPVEEAEEAEAEADADADADADSETDDSADANEDASEEDADSEEDASESDVDADAAIDDAMESEETAVDNGIFWVVVVDGSVTVSTIADSADDGEEADADTAADEEAAADEDEDSPSSSNIEAGQAAAYTTDGELILALAVNEAGVENWYEGVAQGKWGGALTELPDVDPEDDEALAEAVAAAIPSSASFSSDAPEIKLGDCTMLRWSVSGALFVDLDNINVADSGSKEVCPEKSWTYTLHWVGEADSLDHYSYVGVVVFDPSAAPGQEREKPPEVQPIATMCIDGICFIPGGPDDPRLKPPSGPTTEPTPIPTSVILNTPVPRPTKAPPVEPPTSIPPTQTPPPPTGTPTTEPTDVPPSETPDPGTPTETPEPGTPTNTPDPLTPTAEPTEEPTPDPLTPTAEPTEEPTADPLTPTAEPTSEPPTAEPTQEPTPEPTATPV